MKNILFKKGYISLIIIALIIVPSFALASDGEVPETEEIIGDENFDPNIHIEKEEGEVINPSIDKSVPNNKIPSINNKDIVKGGNEKAINSLATKENKARGTVIENVSRGGQPLDPIKVPKIKNEIDSEELKDNRILQDNPVDVRQFLTFQTSSGKTFHLIVDHEKSQDNVQLLTEVGEQDLLNMIEGPKEDKIELKEDIKPIKENEDEEPKIEDIKEPEKENKSKSGLLMILMALAVGGAGYYFKIYKGNQEDNSDDYYDDEEEEYDSEYEDENEGNVDENSEEDSEYEQ